MAQHDFTIDNQSAPAFRGDLNNALEALGTLSSGATAPATTYANMLWYDTANNILKMRSEADDAWIDLGTLDQSGNTFNAAATQLSQGQVEDDTSTVFGQVSGQRLNQSVEANLNVTGAAPMYACRAWVNFNGTGTVSIRASGNVSSITDNGSGDYTVNFATAMPDNDYSISGYAGYNASFSGDIGMVGYRGTDTDQGFTASSVRVLTAGNFGSKFDMPTVSVAIFR